jgi:molecular chaperone Hsp33
MPTSKKEISKFIDDNKSIRVSVVNATDVVKEMQKIQQCYPVAAVMVGRSMVAAALLASQLKENEVVSLYFRGDGPIEMVFAEADFEGGVRGYTPHPKLLLKPPHDILDLGAAIGKGTLNVVHSNTNSNHPYRGTVELQTGEIGDDVAYYLHQSQQIRSVVSLGVKINTYGQVISAGGIIIELLPNADALIETILAERVKEAGSISETIESGASNLDLLDMYLRDFKLKQLDHPYYISYSCRCTAERLRKALELLPLEDLDDIIAKDKSINAKCEFCGRIYDLPISDAQKIRDKKFRNTLN